MDYFRKKCNIESVGGRAPDAAYLGRPLERIAAWLAVVISFTIYGRAVQVPRTTSDWIKGFEYFRLPFSISR